MELHGVCSASLLCLRACQTRTTLSLNTGYVALLLVPGHSIGQRQVSVPLQYLTRSCYLLPTAVYVGSACQCQYLLCEVLLCSFVISACCLLRVLFVRWSAYCIVSSVHSSMSKVVAHHASNLNLTAQPFVFQPASILEHLGHLFHSVSCAGHQKLQVTVQIDTDVQNFYNCHVRLAMAAMTREHHNQV